MKRAALVLVIAIGGLYLFRENLPVGWFNFDYRAIVSVPSAIGNLQPSIGGAMERTADSF